MKQIKQKFKHNYIIKLVIITIIIISLSCLSIYLQKEDNKNIKINNNEFKKEKEKIAVYFTGAIKNEGIYYLKENIRLEEALNIIGGITQEADISKLNLSKVLYDSEKIIIPYRNLDINVNKNVDNIKEEESNLEGININTANLKELITLPGIGEITANKIIEYRKNKPFKDIEDIKKVSGIGNSKFDKIKDKIKVK